MTQQSDRGSYFYEQLVATSTREQTTRFRHKMKSYTSNYMVTHGNLPVRNGMQVQKESTFRAHFGREKV